MCVGVLPVRFGWGPAVSEGLGLRPSQVRGGRGYAPPKGVLVCFRGAKARRTFYDEHFTTNILRRTFFEKVSELVSWARQNKPFLLGLFILRSRSESHEIVAN